MTKRHALAAACWTLVLAGCATSPQQQRPQAEIAQPVIADTLRAGFADPPNAARPRTWWHWMNGNVTQEGIARDLAWMSRVGLGGFQNFDANLRTPQIVDNRLVYMTPEWQEAFRFAVAEADRLDLEVAIAASPGWSETGGPWVQPVDAMKKLVWAETRLVGGTAFSGTINRAPTVTGPFQGMHQEDDLAAILANSGVEAPVASGSVAVLAVPVHAADIPAPSFSLADGTPVDGAVLLDSDLESGFALPLSDDLSGALNFSYPEAVTLQSLQMALPGLAQPFRGSPVLPSLEARQDGEWREIRPLPLSNLPGVYAFDPVTARDFRLRIARNTEITSALAPDGIPGAISFDIFATGNLSTVPLNDFRPSAAQRIDRAELKSGYGAPMDFYEIMSGDDAPVGPGLGDVIDLTDRVAPDGTLDWTPPAGSDWLVLDFGWSLTGKTNHPATPEATGLEVDKFDAGAVRRYVETYLGMYRATLGDELIGERGLRALLTDSIEVGFANWTARMEAEFEARRGYPLRPWMPALAGIVLGSEAETEAFLYDWRETLTELLTDAHYRTVAEVAHENGLIVYGEALEDKRPILGDDLAMRRHADVPMAALWVFLREGEPRTTLIGDMRGAASTAHVYGQDYVAAESLTSAFAPWAFSPRDLRRLIDLEFAHGINRPVIHTSVHVPVEDHAPGLSLMIFGQHFNRNESWAEMARPWVDYMARNSWMLQQGSYFADVALFMGEEAPITAQFATGIPAGLPTQYAYDFVNADMLSDVLRVEASGLISSAGGTRYRALQLGGSSRLMTLPTLRRIAGMALQGATLIGLRPEGSPSLADDATEFAALADATWALPNVIASADGEAALAGLGLAPDFAYTGESDGAEVLFVHRQLDDGGHVYFLTNRANRAESGEARFRVTGFAPELWDAVTGSVRALSYRIQGGNTVVPLEFGPEDSFFVVFREPSDAPSRRVPVSRLTDIAGVDGPWTVAFQEGRGAPASIELATLTPLNEHAEEGVRYFSGVATYSTSFALPEGARPGDPLWLDLGHVADIAEVFVNGQPAGISWLAPDRVAIGDLVKTGANRLEVRVANRWINRLIGDVQPNAQPVTFTATPTYRPDAPLRPAGLIGPVRILSSN